MRMPLRDLPVARRSRPVCRFGRLTRFGIRLIPLSALLRLLRFLRLLVLLIAMQSASSPLCQIGSGKARWWKLTSCHPQTGLKLSKKPTSSKRFG